jgi:predicted P-loop ATPase
MSAQRYGASFEAWDHFADKLGLAEDLLPVVSNPNAEVSELSKMKALGKTPSIYNRDHKVVGLPEWTKIKASEHLIARWRSEPDYGICLQTRSVRAFDIDVEDDFKANEIVNAIRALTGIKLPCRFRSGNGRRLLGFKYNRPLTKHVVPVEHGMVEVLADGQQFIAEGTHPSGERYEWFEGLPVIFPVLTGEQFEAVWQMLVTMFSTGEPRIARERRASSGADLEVHDEVADWLLENWETYDVGRDGQLFIDCPFAAEHTSDSGPTATAYFPAGTGGYSQGHFVCLHAHCTGREDRTFLDATGYSLAQFDDLGVSAVQPPAVLGQQSTNYPDDLPALALKTPFGLVERARIPHAAPPETAGQLPALVRDKNGKIEATAENLVMAIAHGGAVFKRISYDAFTDAVVWAPIEQPAHDAKWRALSDADSTNVRLEMERRGMKAISSGLIRECIYAAGRHNSIDVAKEWLSRLEWDGISRIDGFTIDCWGWKDNDYSRSVGRYLWSAMAGRVLVPGVRADMAPIMAGVQGIRKTTAIQSMVPHEDMYAEIKLNDRDDDISRKLRGKLVAELEELRGLNSRELEDIKAFITRRRESWIPKYKEFENFFWRRNLFIGSTNDWSFLADPTGERRWLPGWCEGELDIDRIVDTRDQLWAEGAALFLLEGVQWQDAERLAKIEHPQFKIADAWERSIMLWLDSVGIDEKRPMDKGHVTAGEVMAGALGIPISQQNRTHEGRVERAMTHLGFNRVIVEEEGYKFKGFAK